MKDNKWWIKQINLQKFRDQYSENNGISVFLQFWFNHEYDNPLLALPPFLEYVDKKYSKPHTKSSYLYTILKILEKILPTAGYSPEINKYYSEEYLAKARERIPILCGIVPTCLRYASFNEISSVVQEIRKLPEGVSKTLRINSQLKEIMEQCINGHEKYIYKKAYEKYRQYYKNYTCFRTAMAQRFRARIKHLGSDVALEMLARQFGKKIE